MTRPATDPTMVDERELAARVAALPKPLREELGVSGPTELEAAARDGVIELTVADVAARVEDRNGTPEIVADEPVAPLTADEVRAAIDRVRR